MHVRSDIFGICLLNLLSNKPYENFLNELVVSRRICEQRRTLREVFSSAKLIIEFKY
jgi:hypothetical protein